MSMLTSFATYRLTTANARKVNTEARVMTVKTETEILQVEANRSVEFERMLNDRMTRLVDSLERQINHLTEVVELQSEQINSLKQEISRLTEALDERTRELQHFSKGSV